MTPKCQGVIKGRHDLLYDPKGQGGLVVGLTLFITQKGHRVITGCRDLLYDLKGDGDLFGQFDLVYDPKIKRGHYR